MGNIGISRTHQGSEIQGVPVPKCVAVGPEHVVLNQPGAESTCGPKLCILGKSRVCMLFPMFSMRKSHNEKEANIQEVHGEAPQHKGG